MNKAQESQSESVAQAQAVMMTAAGKELAPDNPELLTTTAGQGEPEEMTDDKIAEGVAKAVAKEKGRSLEELEASIPQVPKITNPKGRLLVVDGHSLAFRAWYAYNADNFTNGKGQATNAVYGFMSMLSDVCRKEKPTHLAVAFDVKGGTFRNVMLGGYKATRSAAPEELLSQLPLIQRMLHALTIPYIEVPGYEGDDVIATLAAQGELHGYQTLVLSGDRDSFQLIDDNVTVLYPGYHFSDLKHMTAQAVLEKYKVTPRQYPDLAAIRGETSDNIPGVPGVGDGFAAKWINQYGSLAQLVAHAGELTGKKGAAFAEMTDQVMLNRRINVVRRDVDFTVNFDALKIATVDVPALDAILSELNFGPHTRQRLLDTFAPGKSAGASQAAVAGQRGAGQAAGRAPVVRNVQSAGNVQAAGVDSSAMTSAAASADADRNTPPTLFQGSEPGDDTTPAEPDDDYFDDSSVPVTPVPLLTFDHIGGSTDAEPADVEQAALASYSTLTAAQTKRAGEVPHFSTYEREEKEHEQFSFDNLKPTVLTAGLPDAEKLEMWLSEHPARKAQRVAGAQAAQFSNVPINPDTPAEQQGSVANALGTVKNARQSAMDTLLVLLEGNPQPGKARADTLWLVAPDHHALRIDLRSMNLAAGPSWNMNEDAADQDATDQDVVGQDAVAQADSQPEDGEEEETKGLSEEEALEARVALLSGSIPVGQALSDGEILVTDDSQAAFDLFADESAAAKSNAGEQIRRVLNKAFQQRAISVWGYKESLLLAQAVGLKLATPAFDIKLAAFLTSPDKPCETVEEAAHTFLGIEPVQKEVKQRKAKLDWLAGKLVRSRAHAFARPAYLMALQRYLAQLVDGHCQFGLLTNVELPVSQVLARMEEAGTSVDAAKLEEVYQDFHSQAQQAEQIALDVVRNHENALNPHADNLEAQREVNLSSPQQLQTVLFTTLGLKGTKKTARGYSTDATEIDKLIVNYANNEEAITFLTALKRFREQTKLAAMVENLQSTVNPSDNRIHTTYTQTVAATGRLSSVEPNLQNIPNRTPEGREIRSTFVARPRFTSLLSSDYSQVELRIMAHMSGDQSLIDAFRSGADFHKYVASLVYSEPVEQVTDSQRTHVKAMSYGLAYGLSTFGLAQRLEVSNHEAEELKNKYFSTFGKVHDFLESLVSQARRRGYTETLFGRRRYFPELLGTDRRARQAAERAALNAPIQGTAADIMKLAMIRAQKALDEHHVRSQILLQIHDELVVGLAQGEEELVTALVKDAMENAVHLTVPLSVSTGAGPDWMAAAH